MSKERTQLPSRRVRGVAALATGLVLALSSAASASPIPFAGGLLDGVLRTYNYGVFGPNGWELVLLHDYVLGIDFYPGVPLSFVNTATPYSRCVGWELSGLPDCVLPDGPSTLSGGLSDGCSFILGGPLERPPFLPIRVMRGNCSFSQKWAFAESQGWGGLMVVNDADGPVGAVGIEANPNFEPTIAFMRLTKEVGDQIEADRRAHGPVLFEMSVSWTPNSVSTVPEPGTLALMAAGLAACTGGEAGESLPSDSRLHADQD